MTVDSCRWHRCNKPFEQSRKIGRPQVFCSNKCRNARRNWKSAKGQRAVDLVLYGSPAMVANYRIEILQQIKKETPK